VTVDEIIRGIRQVARAKCPGIDGLPAEFYQMFSGPLSKILIWLWKEICTQDTMPKSLRTGVTTLIYKKGDPEDLNNWRPVTLSNVDYKIFAQVMKCRILPLLPKLIGPYQTCNVPGRSIFDNLKFIRDNIDMDGAILQIDQAGAFNNVDHEYMIKVLGAFGFPTVFCKFIRIMYSQISILVNLGGVLVGPVPYQKGVKQGDPMASLLYILALEPLLRRLHTGMLNICPSPFPANAKTNISGYADDTNLFISSMGQFNLIEQELDLFSKYSGGRVNVNKTELLLCGTWTSIAHGTPYKVQNDGIKILGVWFGKATDKNWEILLSKFRTKLDFYSTRSTATSFHSKAQVLNRFLLPILWYVLKILDPPRDFILGIRKLCEDYIWGTRKHWVKRTFVYAPAEFGGLGVKDLEVQTVAMRARDAIKVFKVNKNEYFLKYYAQVMREVIIGNKQQGNNFYENIRLKLNQIRFRVLTLSSELQGKIGVKNTSIFPDLDCEQMLELDLLDVNSVLNWDGNTKQLSAAKRRKLYHNMTIFKKLFQEYQEECAGVKEGKTLFACDCPVRELGNLENCTYTASFFGVYREDSISNVDLGKMRWRKWKRIGKSWMANYEKDVSWRLWHNSLLSFSTAMRMGLVRDSKCPFCEVNRPSSFHMVHCASTKEFWSFIFGIIGRIGIKDKCDKLNGLAENKIGDFMTYLAHNVLYNRTLYYVNSGKKEYDLISSFKQKLNERLVIEYNCSLHSNTSLDLFLDKWNNGLGLFEINDKQLVITI